MSWCVANLQSYNKAVGVMSRIKKNDRKRAKLLQKEKELIFALKRFA